MGEMSHLACCILLTQKFSSLYLLLQPLTAFSSGNFTSCNSFSQAGHTLTPFSPLSTLVQLPQVGLSMVTKVKPYLFSLFH